MNPSRLKLQATARRSLLRAGRRPLALVGKADQAVLRALRTRGHFEPLESSVRMLGLAGEYGALWAGIGLAGAAVDAERRGRWLRGASVGHLAGHFNFLVKVTIGRRRPLITEHPPLARAPSKLSFPSTHSTSSVAAAVALGRVQPRAKLPLYGLAAAICIGRPYLGMHYPSDVIAGVALGSLIGRIVPGLDGPSVEQRLRELRDETAVVREEGDEVEQASEAAAVEARSVADEAGTAAVADPGDADLAPQPAARR